MTMMDPVPTKKTNFSSSDEIIKIILDFKQKAYDDYITMRKRIYGRIDS